MLACTATASARVREDVQRRWACVDGFDSARHAQKKSPITVGANQPTRVARRRRRRARARRTRSGARRRRRRRTTRNETRHLWNTNRRDGRRKTERRVFPGDCVLFFAAMPRRSPSVFATPASPPRRITRVRTTPFARRRTPRGLPAPFPSPSRPSRSAWASINRTFVSSCITRRASRSRRITRRRSRGSRREAREVRGVLARRRSPAAQRDGRVRKRRRGEAVRRREVDDGRDGRHAAFAASLGLVRDVRVGKRKKQTRRSRIRRRRRRRGASSRATRAFAGRAARGETRLLREPRNFERRENFGGNRDFGGSDFRGEEILETLRGLASARPDKPVTLVQLADAWRRATRAAASAPSSSSWRASREDREDFVALMILAGVARVLSAHCVQHERVRRTGAARGSRREGNRESVGDARRTRETRETPRR